MDLEKKKLLLDGLRQKIDDTETWIQDTLKTLKWDQQGLLKGVDCVPCTQDKNHYVPETKAQKHTSCCKLTKQNFTKEEIDHMLSPMRFYEKAKNVITFKPADVDQLVHSVLAARPKSGPQVSNPTLQSLPPDVRLAVYDRLVEEAKKLRAALTGGEDFSFLDDKDLAEKAKEGGNSKEKSLYQQLVEARDMKRRRQSYRAKNVHTTKKSHTEIIREVITNQMEILEKIIKSEEAERSTTASESNSSLRQRHDDTSSERDQHHHHKKKKRKRSRSRSRSISRSRDRRHGSPSDSDHRRHHKRHKHKHKKEREREKERD